MQYSQKWLAAQATRLEALQQHAKWRKCESESESGFTDFIPKILPLYFMFHERIVLFVNRNVWMLFVP